uniref:Uncharacterized protein n=1 Tax=Chromera velia CCMP2878 TaxID=1169474 RepID=A0A0G4FMA9_9ALVE|eukprot:Cvel_17677.t1-p1 / transcript=Cvel_17677.t1 / gene=Cvel_17677 / organism=Chromera_velia_CCMP2878 / gene_product=hypothetical protein / transcript_product=hypothetical protein / location=Cvel_scaffold1425:7957-9721(+) / protein_length=521 / sequence_SO=supercontig / SO=protein_coding / is_pseudo=false
MIRCKQIWALLPGTLSPKLREMKEYNSMKCNQGEGDSETTPAVPPPQDQQHETHQHPHTVVKAQGHDAMSATTTCIRSPVLHGSHHATTAPHASPPSSCGGSPSLITLQQQQQQAPQDQPAAGTPILSPKEAKEEGADSGEQPESVLATPEGFVPLRRFADLFGPRESDSPLPSPPTLTIFRPRATMRPVLPMLSVDDEENEEVPSSSASFASASSNSCLNRQHQQMSALTCRSNPRLAAHVGGRGEASGACGRTKKGGSSSHVRCRATRRTLLENAGEGFVRGGGGGTAFLHDLAAVRCGDGGHRDKGRSWTMQFGSRLPTDEHPSLSPAPAGDRSGDARVPVGGGGGQRQPNCIATGTGCRGKIQEKLGRVQSLPDILEAVSGKGCSLNSPCCRLDSSNFSRPSPCASVAREGERAERDGRKEKEDGGGKEKRDTQVCEKSGVEKAPIRSVHTSGKAQGVSTRVVSSLTACVSSTLPLGPPSPSPGRVPAFGCSDISPPAGDPGGMLPCPPPFAEGRKK